MSSQSPDDITAKNEPKNSKKEHKPTPQFNDKGYGRIPLPTIDNVLVEESFFESMKIPHKKNLPTNFPLPCSDNYRSVSDHVFDDMEKFDFRDVKEGDTVFLKSDGKYFQDFFGKVYPNIKEKFIIVKGGGAHSPFENEKFQKYLDDDKIIGVFAITIGKISSSSRRNKVISIPLGVRCLRFNSKDDGKFRGGDYLSYFQEFWSKYEEDEKSFPKSSEKLVFCNFGHLMWDFRKKCLDYFETKGKDFTDVLLNLKRDVFFNQIASHYFSVSPKGNAYSCHRTWEILYLGGFPIVPNNSIAPVFENLPVFAVDEWEEVTEKSLLQKREEFTENWENFEWERVFIGYYLLKIKELQDHFRINTPIKDKDLKRMLSIE